MSIFACLAATIISSTAHGRALTVGPPVPGYAGRDNTITVSGATPGLHHHLELQGVAVDQGLAPQ